MGIKEILIEVEANLMAIHVYKRCVINGKLSASNGQFLISGAREEIIRLTKFIV